MGKRKGRKGRRWEKREGTREEMGKEGRDKGGKEKREVKQTATAIEEEYIHHRAQPSEL